MVAVSSLEELKTMQDELKKVQAEHPGLYTKWLHLVNLTRQLQFKHHFMGTLLLDTEPGRYYPDAAKASVIRLYVEEAEKLKQDPQFHLLQAILRNHSEAGFSKISRLSLGHSPESLAGVSTA
ncbi:hypothetical protein GKZ89_14850 [Bacillus mangrovi]|uniref:Uncharacterized protein n=1 Tax=Metabacillus mangrovi TaxID=1491830 RepID=A0A7X2S6Q4_9BACI|nr:hypothetical protein [Metabacillus mangrovi]MTH54679.1 hypothetical protein [Metabacillus mangrovi]